MVGKEWKIPIGAIGVYRTAGLNAKTGCEGKYRKAKVLDHLPANINAASLGYKLKADTRAVIQYDRYIVEVPQIDRQGKETGKFEIMAPMKGAFERTFEQEGTTSNA